MAENVISQKQAANAVRPEGICYLIRLCETLWMAVFERWVLVSLDWGTGTLSRLRIVGKLTEGDCFVP
jgi:hypothetical protein